MDNNRRVLGILPKRRKPEDAFVGVTNGAISKADTPRRPLPYPRDADGLALPAPTMQRVGSRPSPGPGHRTA